MSALIAASVWILQGQELEVHATIGEAVNALVPLTALEFHLQRALNEELRAEHGEYITDQNGLATSVDRLFTELESRTRDPDLPMDALSAAHKHWLAVRPAISGLLKRVIPLRPDDRTRSSMSSTADLTVAIQDVEVARTRLATAIKARAAASAASQQRQLRRLIWTWVGTLAAALFVLAAMTYSIVKPTRELAQTIRRLGAGDFSARLNTTAGDELGEVARYLNSMADRLAHRSRALENEALRDSLTGLPNRRAVLAALDSNLNASSGVRAPVSVLMIDVDRFKQINDRFGHAAGDEALIRLAELMRRALRGDDVLGRYAGDEFLAVLPGASHQQACQVAERLCDSVNRWAADEPNRPSITVGVATNTADTNTARRLITEADRALYRGKAAGGAQVAAAGKGP